MTTPDTLIAADAATNCKHCESPVHGKYCSACGLPVKLQRVDSHYISHEIQHLLHFEKGILYTVKELLIRPGKNVREFILDNRSRLVKPIVFIIITSLVYSTISHFFHIEKAYVSYSGDKTSAISSIFAWIEGHYGYSNIIMGVFIAFWVRLFFKKSDYNFYEILILLCFIMGIAMLIFSVFTIMAAILKAGGIMQVAALIGVGYCSWAVGQFFNSKKAGWYLKAFAAYMLGMVSFSSVALLLGALIDKVLQH